MTAGPYVPGGICSAFEVGIVAGENANVRAKSRIRIAAPRRICHSGAEEFSCKSGVATRRCAGVLRPAVDRAIADPYGHCAIARHRSDRVASDPPALPGMVDSWTVWGTHCGTQQFSRASRSDGLGPVGDDAVLQLPGIHSARECDVCDPPPSRCNSQAPLSCLGGYSVLLHSLARTWAVT